MVAGRLCRHGTNIASFDLFFMPPTGTMAVSDVQYLLTFGVMLTVGLIVGNLTAGVRYQARVARYREQRARHLYEMAKILSSAPSRAISFRLARSLFTRRCTPAADFAARRAG